MYIAKTGMGGFLNPPTHPEHTMSVQDRYGCMSLSAAAKDESINASIREQVQRILDEWQAPAIDSPEIQDWIHQVLGYFRGCYQGYADLGEKSWHVNNLRITGDADPMLNIDQHAGVNLIRKYYPDFTPTQQHFDQAYWGQIGDKKEFDFGSR